MDLVEIIQWIMGKNGRRIPEYGGIANAWSCGVMPSYYRGSRNVDKTIRHYLNRTWPLPRELTNTYTSPNDYPNILADMESLCQTVTSLHRLRRIQEEIHQMVIASVPEGRLGNLEEHYVATGASRHQIATYLADVLHGAAIMRC